MVEEDFKEGFISFGTVQSLQCNYLRYCVLREILKYGAIKLNLELSFETQYSHQRFSAVKMKLFELNS
jgi:hypothetical protein